MKNSQTVDCGRSSEPLNDTALALSGSNRTNKSVNTLEYWCHYTKIPSAWRIVSSGVEYFHVKLMLRNIWASKAHQNAWAEEALINVMDSLGMEPFTLVPGMNVAVS